MTVCIVFDRKRRNVKALCERFVLAMRMMSVLVASDKSWWTRGEE